jgi:nicotinate-nucleotide pyrophosphorylase (carboxylating)
MKTFISPIPSDIAQIVSFALVEDIGSGDITAQLIAANCIAAARVITRQHCVVAGRPWVDEVFRQLDTNIVIRWQVEEGQNVSAGTTLLELQGDARTLLTGERTALNFLQLLSGTATRSRYYADLVSGTGVRLLDTRKTIPGLRSAQKYAVICGGCYNHRMGLYDAFLIKENHIAACGGIAQAVKSARLLYQDKTIEIEVEDLNEFQQALDAKADIILLDNFSIEDLYKAVIKNKGKTPLEASGGITTANLRSIAETGVDYISIGALTKDCDAIDLSMRFE